MTHLTAAHPAPAPVDQSAGTPLLAVPPAGGVPTNEGATSAQRALIVIGATLVAVVAMAASATTLADLGRAVGWGTILAWSLPVSVDVLALVAGLAWLAGGAGRGLGRSLTLITVAVSVSLNAIGHLVSTEHLKTGSYLVIGVSAVPPLAAALAVHLGATVNADRTDTPAVQPAGTINANSGERTAADQQRGDSSTGGPADRTDPEPVVHGDARDRKAEPDRLRTTGQLTEPASADHDADAPHERTNSALDHADQQTVPRPQEAAHNRRTRQAAGRAAAEASQPTDHVRADNAGGSADGNDPAVPDHGGPADQARAQDHLQVTDHTSRTTDQPTKPAPADHNADAPHVRTDPAPDHTDQPADQDEDDSSGGPKGARSTSHDAAPTRAQTRPADQDDEVPWEVKVEVARQAALAEGRMTRRAIRPHLRDHGITVSNELFSELQTHLYGDPTLAHLPRPPRKTR